MWPFRRGGDTEGVASYTHEERAAYVERDPMIFRGRRLGGKVATEAFKFQSLDDLEQQVEALAGGGSYTARIMDRARRKTLGKHRFTLEGDPLVSGAAIDPPEPVEEKPAKKKDQQDPVEKLRVERERVQAEKELRRTEIEARKELAQMDPEEEDDDFGPLRAKIESLEAELAAQREREQRRSEMQPILDKIGHLESRLEGASSGDGGLESIRLILEAQQKATSAMIERSEAANKGTLDMLRMLVDTKEAKSEQVLALMKEAVQLGMASAQGRLGDMEPKGPLDVINSVVERVGDIVESFAAAKKGAVSSDEVRRIAEQAGSDVADQIKGEMALPSPEDEESTSGKVLRMPAPATAPRAAMNRFLEGVVRRSRSGGKVSQDWLVNQANKLLPGSVLGELAAVAGNPQGLLNVVSRYGDARLVDSALRVLRAAGLGASEQAESEAGDEAEVQPPAAEVAEEVETPAAEPEQVAEPEPTQPAPKRGRPTRRSR